jgi:hypothetical protein
LGLLNKSIQLIQANENKRENLPNIIWGNNKVGVWQTGIIMAAGWSDRFVIHSDNRLEYYYSQMRALPLINSMSGTYTIKGNVLEFRVNKVYYGIHHLGIEYGINGYDWINDETNTITFEKPLVYKFPITSISTKTFGRDGDLQRESITIGGQNYYKLSDDVNDKF